jgi:hypothetical protein
MCATCVAYLILLDLLILVTFGEGDYGHLNWNVVALHILVLLLYALLSAF